MTEGALTENHHLAARLLYVLWRSIPQEYLSRYKHNIWEQFEGTVRAKAYTSSLTTFVNDVARAFGAPIGSNDWQREQVAGILRMGRDREILSLLRSEPAVIVLLVRLERQKERQLYAKEDNKDEE